jgi:hypothetical protein
MAEVKKHSPRYSPRIQQLGYDLYIKVTLRQVFWRSDEGCCPPDRVDTLGSAAPHLNVGAA